MSHRTALLRLGAAFLGAVVIWLLAGALFPEGYTRTRHVIRALTVFTLVMAMWWVISHRTRTLRRPHAADLRNGLIGALSYLIPAGLGITVALATGVARVKPGLELGPLLIQGLAALALVLAFEAIPEELVYRDLIYTSLGARWGRWAAVFGQAALFTLFAVLIGAATSVDRIILMAVFGLAQGLVRLATGTVAATIGFHAAFQTTAQWLVGGTWAGWETHDPQLWLAGAVFLPPMLLAPVLGRLLRSARGPIPSRREACEAA